MCYSFFSNVLFVYLLIGILFFFFFSYSLNVPFSDTNYDGDEVLLGNIHHVM